jgi:hypothetical protein
VVKNSILIPNREADGLKTPPNSPASSSSSSVLLSPEKLVKELRSRTITTDVQYAKPKSKSRIKRSMTKVKSQTNIGGKLKPL